MSMPLLTQYLQPLLGGRRADCFNLVQEALRTGVAADRLIFDVVWPARKQVELLYRDDRINAATENMASRINRTVADQIQPHLEQQPDREKTIVIACAVAMREELGAQIIADLFQADGWDVFFLGGGVPRDEVLELIGPLEPTALLLFGSEPQDVPAIRALVELIREIGVCPTMSVIVSGGVFDRADGLWREVGADLYEADPRQLVELASEIKPHEPNEPRRDVVKKRRRKRKHNDLPTEVFASPSIA